jgi:hypothetical protein
VVNGSSREWTGTATGVVGADGRAEVAISPQPAGRYVAYSITVSLSRPAASRNALVSLYRDAVGQTNRLESTRSADGDSTTTPHRFRGGSSIIAVWTSCPPGAVAALRVDADYLPGDA